MPVLRLILGAAAALVMGASPAAHPLHTTLTQLEYVSGSRALQGSMRVFADDFAMAASRHTGAKVGPDHAISDSAAFAYAAATLTLIDRNGQHLSLKWCGRKRTGDLIWLYFSVSAPRGMTGSQIDARMLFDVYHDQVNIIQVTNGSRRQSLLFTQGDGPKQLR